MKAQYNATLSEPVSIENTEDDVALIPTSTSTMPNVLVYGVEVYTSDSSAIYRVRLRRVESYSNFSSFGSIKPSRETLITSNYQIGFLTTPAGIDELSKHIVTLNSPLVYRFSEPIECTRDWQSSTDHFFDIGITRLDSSTAANVFVNIHFSEY